MSGYLIVEGIMAGQTPLIEKEFINIVNDFDTIIEIGYNRGALTLWFKNNSKAKVIAYDITNADNQVDKDRGIDFRIGNCFDPLIVEDIKNEITNGNRVLLLCDGGEKNREFELFSDFIKPNDVIMIHDYMHSPEEYVRICSEIDWTTPAESNFSAIENSVIRNNLKPYRYEEFKNVLWGSFIKE